LLKNLFRNKLRTALTVSSIAASIFLVAVLISLLDGLTNPPETPDSALRLITRHKISLFNTLPVGYREKIAALEGVDAVIGSMWFGGMYDNSGVDQMLAQFAVDTDQFFIVNPDMVLAEDLREAFLQDRGGAIVGNVLADSFGWKIGDRIHTRSNLFPIEPLELNIRGIYQGGGDQGGGVYYHWDYFDKAIKEAGIGDSFTGTFSIRARSAEDVPRIAAKVDALFENSSSPTKTETEKAFILGFLSMMGNVQLLISGICTAILFAVILVAANTMAMSIRERTREIGIMKALGFRRIHVLSLLLSESVLLAFIGSALGAVLARLLLDNVNLAMQSGGMVPNLSVGAGILLLCTGIGVLVGFVAAGVPALRAANRPVVEAIRNVA
jgi:putative ABC transport system permease protein